MKVGELVPLEGDDEVVEPTDGDPSTPTCDDARDRDSAAEDQVIAATIAPKMRRGFADGGFLRIVIIAAVLMPKSWFEMVSMALAWDETSWTHEVGETARRVIDVSWYLAMAAAVGVISRHLRLRRTDFGLRTIRPLAAAGWAIAALFLFVLPWSVVAVMFDDTAVAVFLRSLVAPYLGGVRFDHEPVLISVKLLLGGLVLPIVEEILFRGLALAALPTARARWTAASGSTLLFAATYCAGDALNFVAASLIGASLSVVFAACRNLWPLVACRVFLSLAAWFPA